MSRNEEFLKELKCSGCGQSITDFDRNADTVTCPFCKKKFLNPFKNSESSSEKEFYERKSGNSTFIIPFKEDVESFSDQIISHLTTTNDVPLDIFNQLSFDRIEKLYVPYFTYQGNFYCSWNCEVPIKSGSNTEYRHHSGNTNGNFKILISAWGNASDSEENRLPSGIAQFIDNFAVNNEIGNQNGAVFEPSMVQNSDDQNEPKFKVLNANQDSRSLWNSYGQTIAGRIAENRAREIAPEGFRKLKCSTSVELDPRFLDKSETVLVPFWFTQYSYCNQQFYFVSSGVNKNTNDWTHPVDPALKTMEERFGLGIGASLILAVIVFFASSWAWATIPLGLALTLFIINLNINNKNKEQRKIAARAVFGDQEILNKL